MHCFCVFLHSSTLVMILLSFHELTGPFVLWIVHLGESSITYSRDTWKNRKAFISDWRSWWETSTSVSNGQWFWRSSIYVSKHEWTYCPKELNKKEWTFYYFFFHVSNRISENFLLFLYHLFLVPGFADPHCNHLSDAWPMQMYDMTVSCYTLELMELFHVSRNY